MFFVPSNALKEDIERGCPPHELAMRNVRIRLRGRTLTSTQGIKVRELRRRFEAANRGCRSGDQFIELRYWRV